jgi:DoxX
MHAPAILGYLVGLTQFAGGLAILTGAFLRVGAICVIIVMFGAIFLVHLPHGFDVGRGGYEFALTELLLAFALLVYPLGVQVAATPQVWNEDPDPGRDAPATFPIPSKVLYFQYHERRI